MVILSEDLLFTVLLSFINEETLQMLLLLRAPWIKILLSLSNMCTFPTTMHERNNKVILVSIRWTLSVQASHSTFSGPDLYVGSTTGNIWSVPYGTLKDPPHFKKSLKSTWVAWLCAVRRNWRTDTYANTARCHQVIDRVLLTKRQQCCNVREASVGESGGCPPGVLITSRYLSWTRSAAPRWQRATSLKLSLAGMQSQEGGCETIDATNLNVDTWYQQID